MNGLILNNAQAQILSDVAKQLKRDLAASCYETTVPITGGKFVIVKLDYYGETVVELYYGLRVMVRESYEYIQDFRQAYGVIVEEWS